MKKRELYKLVAELTKEKYLLEQSLEIRTAELVEEKNRVWRVTNNLERCNEERDKLKKQGADAEQG